MKNGKNDTKPAKSKMCLQIMFLSYLTELITSKSFFFKLKAKYAKYACCYILEIL